MFRLIAYAESFLGTPYKYGSNSHLDGGIDCSGFVIEVLKSVGEAPPIDMSAQGLFDYFSNGRATWNVHKAGSLVFFGQSASDVRHVGIMVDEWRMIEASGGDATTLTPEDARKKNAFVKMRLVSHRKDPFRAILRPYYRKIGEI